MNEKSKKKDIDPGEKERQDALAALKRARQRAERLAAATGTAIIEARDGKPVRISPSDDSPRP